MANAKLRLEKFRDVSRHHRSSGIQNFQWKKILQIDNKWLETRKKTRSRRPVHRRPRRPILRVEYDNTSYQTTFHQNLSINVAYPQKSFGCLKVSDGASPPLISANHLQ